VAFPCAVSWCCCNRWVIDDHLLLRIASERPSLVSLIIRPEADIDCRITEYATRLHLSLVAWQQPGARSLCWIPFRSLPNVTVALSWCKSAMAGI